MVLDDSAIGQLRILGNKVVELHGDVRELKAGHARVETKVDAIYERVIGHSVDLAVVKHSEKGRRELAMMVLKVAVTIALSALVGAATVRARMG